MVLYRLKSKLLMWASNHFEVTGHGLGSFGKIKLVVKYTTDENHGQQTTVHRSNLAGYLFSLKTKNVF